MNQRSHQLSAFVFHFTLFLDIIQKSLIQNFLLFTFASRITQAQMKTNQRNLGASLTPKKKKKV